MILAIVFLFAAGAAVLMLRQSGAMTNGRVGVAFRGTEAASARATFIWQTKAVQVRVGGIDVADV